MSPSKTGVTPSCAGHPRFLSDAIKQDVDGRDKPGHDVERPGALAMKLPRDIGPVHFVGIGGNGVDRTSISLVAMRAYADR
jgi:hypothetical protein